MAQPNGYSSPTDIKPTISSLSRPGTLSEDSSSGLTSEKVAEVFLTAGHAFQKLGDLALKLRTPISENADETKWENRTVDRLKDALTKFAHELDNISDSVQARTVGHIKTDIKRKVIVVGDRLDPLKTPAYSGANTPQNQRANFSQCQLRQSASNSVDPQAPLKTHLSPPHLQQQHLGGNSPNTSGGAQKMPQQTRLVHVQGNSSSYESNPGTSQRRYSPYNAGSGGQIMQQKRIISQNSNFSANSAPPTVFRSVRMPPMNSSMNIRKSGNIADAGTNSNLHIQQSRPVSQQQLQVPSHPNSENTTEVEMSNFQI